jgi:tetratricopeptide (TPR) repeat protein
MSEKDRPALVVRHEAGSEGYRFVVQRVSGSSVKAAPGVVLSDPLPRQLEPTQYTLGQELAWYLESYLDYPFGPNEQRAQRVTDALRCWGTEAFKVLFDTGQARDFYHDAVRNGHVELQLVITSDDAGVLAWPWEALHDPLVGDLAHLCRIERQLDHVSDPLPPSENLARDRIGILLVTARPYEGDVAYLSISRPLVELIHARRLPAEVTVLRPPTFKQLREELQARPGAYHIVHFDGHGAFGQVPVASSSAHALRGPRGQLVFEKDDGSADAVSGEQLSQLLREFRIPIAVLNACQSGMQSAEAEDAFASVATALLRAGVRSVVAMGYSLYVSAAREFLPAFYERLFASGSIAEATRGGRQALLAQPKRMSARGLYPLQDWLVPVLYQQQPLTLDFSKQAKTSAAAASTAIPEGARLDIRETPYGFIGRDRAVLALERAARRAPAGLLVHGLGGVGKTTLVRGFIEWLAQTDGLSGAVVPLSFVGIGSAAYVINRLVEVLFGTDAMAAPDAQKLPTLVRALREQPLILVWDNFESASGMADAGLESPMPAEDRQQLKTLLEQLRGGKTKVLITSRSDEAWLGSTACFRIPLGGLVGEERWALAEAMLQDLGIKANRDDAALADLLNELEGHPLMMRAVLPRLATQSATVLRAAIEQYVPEADSTDPVEQRLYATLRYVESGLPEKLKPLLYPLSLHQGCADAGLLYAMSTEAGQEFNIGDTTDCLMLLKAAGLTHWLGDNTYRVHPGLTRYLRARSQSIPHDDGLAIAWQSAFVRTLANVASKIGPAVKIQRPFLSILGDCVIAARLIARQIGATTAYATLTQTLASYALSCHDLPRAKHLYEDYARSCETVAPAHLAAAYNQLGLVALQARDFASAESWFHKSRERPGDQRTASATYHHLGMLAQMRRDSQVAGECYRKALEIEQDLPNHEGTAATNHQLGTLAEDARDFAAAEDWYNKALEISIRLGNERDSAKTYFQLGSVAEERPDLAAAELAYQRALEISQRLGDEYTTAGIFTQLGTIARRRDNFSSAAKWYRKALAINERIDNIEGAAITYQQFGSMARQRRDFAAAESWYRKALGIEERIGDKHAAGMTYGSLGLTSEQRGLPIEAAKHLLKALSIFISTADQYMASTAARDLRRIYEAASIENQSRMEELGREIGFRDFRTLHTILN